MKSLIYTFKLRYDMGLILKFAVLNRDNTKGYRFGGYEKAHDLIKKNIYLILYIAYLAPSEKLCYN